VFARQHLARSWNDRRPYDRVVPRLSEADLTDAPIPAPFGGERSSRSLVVRQRSGMEGRVGRRDMDKCRLPVGPGFGDS
jgi:hypothetical protein